MKPYQLRDYYFMKTLFQDSVEQTDEAGSTLIGVMVVIATIGILVAVAGGGGQGGRGDAFPTSRCFHELQVLQGTV